jgi:hypothetical protein
LIRISHHQKPKKLHPRKKKKLQWRRLNLKDQQNSNGWKIVPPQIKAYSPEWFLFNYLENWDQKDLDIAIRKDVRPDLSGYADLILDQTTDFFLNLFKVHRPDLAERMKSKDGKEWLKKIVKSATTMNL